MLKLCTVKENKKISITQTQKQRFGATMQFPEGLEDSPFSTRFVGAIVGDRDPSYLTSLTVVLSIAYIFTKIVSIL